MLTREEEELIRQRAYVPEHVVPLMAAISQAEPFFRGDHLFFVKDDWMILVGYPLSGPFAEEGFSVLLSELQKDFRPAVTFFVAPCIPESLLPRVRGKEADRYYRLDLGNSGIKRNLQREVEKASLVLRVEKGREWSPGHAALTREFLGRGDLPPRVRELYLRVPQLLAHSKTSLVLSARDPKGTLCGFFVVGLEARNFAVYLAGCYSQKSYSSHASDLLFREMIGLAREQGKEYIHLGLGVNEGIRRFKKKWGGLPGLPYFAGEIHWEGNSPLSWFRELASRI